MLDAIHIFSDIEPEVRAILEKHIKVRKYDRNTVIIHEGDDAHSLYLLLLGKVDVFLTNDDGRKIIINTQHAGDIFGELALLDGTPRSASVITTEPSQLGILSREDFHEILLEHPVIALSILKQLTLRIRLLSENVKNLALLDVYGRVAKTLLDMAELDNGVMTIKDRPTHQDIADRIGSSREMVSRIMKDLAIGKYITIDGKGLIINDYLPKHY